MQDNQYWWKQAKIYELYVDKFARNFKGLTARLDYFNHLGINTLHILPHYPSPMVDDGYDVSDYRGVRKELGTMDDFVECVEEAHKRGIKIMTDLVLNHVSTEHHWFVDARASKDNPKRDFFLWSETGREFKNAINAFPDFKSSNWIWNEATQDYYYATFYPEQPDLNWDNHEVLYEILKRVDFWTDIGVDGFRLDAIPHLVERENTMSYGLPETHHIIKVLRKHLDEKHSRGIALLAEIAAKVGESKGYFGEGDECHLVYNFALMNKMLLALVRKDLGIIHDVAHESLAIPESCQWAVFLRNHDEVNLHTLSDEERIEVVNAIDPKHLYPFNKGNATSIRLGSIFAHEPERLIEAFELLYSTPGAPIMYYGDEIGMKNLPIQSRIKDTRRYVRGDFEWDTAEKMLANPDSLLNRVATIIRR